MKTINESIAVYDSLYEQIGLDHRNHYKNIYNQLTDVEIGFLQAYYENDGDQEAIMESMGISKTDDNFLDRRNGYYYMMKKDNIKKIIGMSTNAKILHMGFNKDFVNDKMLNRINELENMIEFKMDSGDFKVSEIKALYSLYLDYMDMVNKMIGTYKNDTNIQINYEIPIFPNK